MDIREQRKTSGASHRSLVYTGLATLAIALVGLLAFRAFPALRLKDSGVTQMPQQGNDAPAPSPLPPRADAESLNPFSGRDFGFRSGFQPASPVEGPFEPVEAHIFRNEIRTYVLDGIAGPPAAAICLGDDKRLWACGLQARAALIGLIRHAQPFCRRATGRGGRKARDPGAETWDCTLQQQDLAQRLVEGGWALPITRSDRDILAARENARTGKRGLWDGGWNVVRVPGSEAVPMSPPEPAVSEKSTPGVAP